MVLTAQAEAVKGVIGRDVQEVRPTATSVYAFLAGKDGVEYLRSLLADKDPDVRAVAIGALASQKDTASIERMAVAAQGVNDATLACKVIDAAAEWGEVGVVPVLIPFLQNDGFSYGISVDDDAGIPAVRARQRLHTLTGHWFPYDVEAAAKVWKEAAAVTDAAKRNELLNALLVAPECPVVAEMVGSPRFDAPKVLEGPGASTRTGDSPDESLTPRDATATALVRLGNTSDQRITLAKSPTHVSESEKSATGSWSGGGTFNTEPLTKTDFLSLEPGASTEIEVKLNVLFLRSEPKDRKVTLIYARNGKALGLKTWMGRVDARFGSEWKEDGKIEVVEQHWPNGELKVFGLTLDGRRYWYWQYFDEQRRLIRTESYAPGHGPAESNPAHPSSEAAGTKAP